MNEAAEMLVRSQARHARATLSLGEGDPVDAARVLRLLEGISVVRMPFDGKISGCFVRGSKAKVIILNSRRTLGHQNFTIAHEFYHLNYEPELTGSVCPVEASSGRSESETRADAFSREFLMPAQAVEQVLFSIAKGARAELTMADMVELEQYFSVSHQAMLVRMKELKWLNLRQAAALEKGITQTARCLGYDTCLYEATDESSVSSPYLRLAREALDRGAISWGKFSQLLGEAGLAALAVTDPQAEPEGSHEEGNG